MAFSISNNKFLQSKLVQTYWWIWLSALIVIIIIISVGVVLWINHTKTQRNQLSDQFLQSLTIQNPNSKIVSLKKIATASGGPYPGFANIILAQLSLKKGNLPLASQYFNQASHQLSKNTLGQFAKAMAIYSDTTKTVQLRIDQMKPLVQPNKPLYSVLGLYLASLYLENGNDAQAQTLLSSLSNAPQVSKRSQATYISRQLATSIGAFRQ